MLKSKCILFTLLYCTLNLYSQNVSIEGFVKDSLQNPLSFANIIAKPDQADQNITFAISDENGQYKLNVKKGGAYIISVSFMGYEEINQSITVEINTTKNFILKELKNQLDEVIIELPVTIKQDTIVYDTKYFVSGNERKLKNVLKKLPGVEVDKDGTVTVQGKKVSKMLVDGKKFFGGGTKLAVDNIPADAIDKIEVLDNHNDVSFLKAFSDSEEMAMNIKLKEDKKRFVFGDIESGKGNESFYKTHANLFYYAPKTNVNFIGNLNNSGERTFTFDDYLNFSGGVNAIFSGNFDFKGGDFTQFLQSQDVINSNQRFGAVNINKVISSKITISGYSIFSHSNTEDFSETLNKYATLLEDKESRRNLKNVFGIGKLNFEYSPNLNEQYYLRSQVKRSVNFSSNTIISESTDESNTIATNNNNQAWYANQSLEWHKKLSNKHTFSTNINYILDKNNPLKLWKTNQLILQELIPIDTLQNLLSLKQSIQNKKNYLNVVFKDFWVLNNNNHIYSTIGNSNQREEFNTLDNQILDDGSVKDFSSSNFNNKTIFKLNDFFLGLHYKFRTGIFMFKQGVFFHKYDWNVSQQNILTNKKWIALPDFLMKIEFSNSKKIQINYNLNSNFSEASKLANSFYLQSYNSVFRGNETLENELSHSARIRYSRFSLYRELMLTISANYSKKINGFVNSVEFEDINQFLTIQMLENPNEMWGLNTSIRKTIKNIKYKLRGNYSNSNYTQSIDDSVIKNKSENVSFDISAETLYDKLPNIEFGFKRSIGNFTSSNSISRFKTDEPYVNVNYDFSNDFNFLFDYTHYNYQNKEQGIKNSYNIANATLSYKTDDSAWSYKVEAKNIFNTQFKQESRFSEYLISDTKTYILPLTLMFSIGYNL